MEREIVARILEGKQRDLSDPMLISPQSLTETEDHLPELKSVVPIVFHNVKNLAGRPELRKSFKLKRKPTIKNSRYSNWLNSVREGTTIGRRILKQSAC